MTQMEIRTFHNVDVRAAGSGPNGRPQVTLRAITPYVVDDYGSVWLPDVFDESCADATDLPSLCWAHRWDDPIGGGRRYTAGADGPDVVFELDDFDAVPRAKQAHAQVQSKTIRDCSVGFSNVQRRSPTDAELKQWPGCSEVIERATLDEVSLVLRGAVPGAKVTGMRSKVVDTGVLLDLAKRVNAGELTEAEAQVALSLAAGDDGTGDELEGDPPPEVDEAAEALAAADEAIAGIGGRGRF